MRVSYGHNDLGVERLTEVEVAVVSNRPVVTGLAVAGDVLTVALVLAVVVDHVGVQGVVEHEVVTTSSEVVIASERGVTFELVVAVQAKLWAKTRRGGPGGGIAAEGDLGGDRVAVKADTEDGEQDCEIVAYTVDVLLSVGEFGEGNNSVAGQETVVGGWVDVRKMSYL